MLYNILDTNVILRFLVGDNKEQQKMAIEWFKEAESGKREIVVPSIVIAEASFVLESFYKKSRTEIAFAMEVFLSQGWLKVENRKILTELWTWYRLGFHFVDSFLLSWSKADKYKILTFDKQILKK